MDDRVMVFSGGGPALLQVNADITMQSPDGTAFTLPFNHAVPAIPSVKISKNQRRKTYYNLFSDSDPLIYMQYLSDLQIARLFRKNTPRGKKDPTLITAIIEYERYDQMRETIRNEQIGETTSTFDLKLS